jgi:hypothetical protein
MMVAEETSNLKKIRCQENTKIIKYVLSPAYHCINVDISFSLNSDGSAWFRNFLKPVAICDPVTDIALFTPRAQN